MILLIRFFACVLVEAQFLGYKFGLKGSTYTQESMVTAEGLSMLGPKSRDLRQKLQSVPIAFSAFHIFLIETMQ